MLELTVRLTGLLVSAHLDEEQELRGAQVPVRQVLAAGLEDGVGRGQALRQAIIMMLELSRKDSACTESPTALLVPVAALPL